MKETDWFYPASQFIFPNLYADHDSKKFLHYPSNLIVDSKFIKIHSRDYDRIQELSQWRFQTQYPVFKILRARLQQEKRQYAIIQIFVQKPEYLLYELNNITLLQALYIINSCLPALERLVERFGYFQLNDRMIGLSRTSECKLWINDQIQKFQIVKKANGQKDMVDLLLRLVQKYTNKNQKVKQFFSYANYQCTTFMKAQKFIQFYVYQKGFVIPPQFYTRNRREIAQNSSIRNRINQYNCQSCTRSYILQNRQRQLSPYYLPKSCQRTNFVIQQPKPFVIDLHRKIPMKISKKDSLKAVFQMKSSKQTQQNSKQSLIKHSYCQRKSFLESQFQNPKKSWLNSNIHNKSQCPKFLQNVIEARNRKKLAIMSTIDIKVVSNTIKKQQQFLSQKKIKNEIFQSKDFYKQKLDNNKWKQTISQLFSSQQNLKESISYGQQEKNYVNQIELQQLGKFGRFITTSVLEIQEIQQQSLIQNFDK